VPNYLRAPSFPYLSTVPSTSTSTVTPQPMLVEHPTITLLCRIADDPNEKDFIEFDFHASPLHGSYERLRAVLCEEFHLDYIDRIRRLPHVRIRDDRDIQRLKDNHMLEIIMKKTDATNISSSTDS
jgi:hypothetical protein